MSILVKSTVLSLSLLAGVAVSAYAQSENVATLPPRAVVTPPLAAAAVAPSNVFLGRDPGTAWQEEQNTVGAVQPSAQQFGAIRRGDVSNDFE